MPIRSLLFSTVVLCGSILTASAQTPDTPKPHLAVPSPRYVGPMGVNPHPSAFAAPQTNKAAFSLTPPSVMVVPRGDVVFVTSSRKSICYTLHSYTITPESDTVGITHPTSESTCIAAETFTLKQAVQPQNGPDFR